MLDKLQKIMAITCIATTVIGTILCLIIPNFFLIVFFAFLSLLSLTIFLFAQDLSVKKANKALNEKQKLLTPKTKRPLSKGEIIYIIAYFFSLIVGLLLKHFWIGLIVAFIIVILAKRKYQDNNIINTLEWLTLAIFLIIYGIKLIIKILLALLSGLVSGLGG